MKPAGPGNFLQNRLQIGPSGMKSLQSGIILITN
jgi:hypothetical protein